MIACVVPGCEEPFERLVWAGGVMCHRHLRAELIAHRDVENNHRIDLDEYDPLKAHLRVEAERAEAEQRRREALERIDRDSWDQPEGSRYGLKALENIVTRLRADQGSGRNNALNRAAFACGQLVSGGELSPTTAEEVLTWCGDAMKLPKREASDTIKRGMRDGERHPLSRSRDEQS